MNHGFSSQLLMLLPLFLVFYFFIIRPQNKKVREHRDLLTKLTAGDEVVTTSGILGKVEKITGDFLVIGLADSASTIIMQRQAVAQILPKGTLKAI